MFTVSGVSLHIKQYKVKSPVSFSALRLIINPCSHLIYLVSYLAAFLCLA
jgi:hypothetical protein